jgi:hypothetical protein
MAMIATNCIEVESGGIQYSKPAQTVTICCITSAHSPLLIKLKSHYFYSEPLIHVNLAYIFLFVLHWLPWLLVCVSVVTIGKCMCCYGYHGCTNVLQWLQWIHVCLALVTMLTCMCSHGYHG